MDTLQDIEARIVREIQCSVYPYVEFFLKAFSMEKLDRMVERWSLASRRNMHLQMRVFYHRPTPSVFQATVQFWEPTSKLQFDSHATASPLYAHYKSLFRDATKFLVMASRRAYMSCHTVALLEFDYGDVESNFSHCEIYRRIAIHTGFRYAERTRQGDIYILQWSV